MVANQVLFVDAVRWLGGEEIRRRGNDGRRLRIEHTKQKDLVWFYGSIFGAPALVLGIGLVRAAVAADAAAGKPAMS